MTHIIDKTRVLADNRTILEPEKIDRDIDFKLELEGSGNGNISHQEKL